MKYDTIMDAAYAWVQTFNAFQYGIVERLVESNIDEWTEITLPSIGDRVNYWDAETKKGNPVLKGLWGYGEIVGRDGDRYIVDADDRKTNVYVNESDIEITDTLGGFLPAWGTMWQFGNSCDDWWLEENLQEMCDCGFRVYKHEEWGYFFGIDGAGYDFYEAHWIPLYKARGLQWHKTEEEKTA